MRFYPDVPEQRWGLVFRDLALVLALVVLAKLGLIVHDAVDELAVLGEGVESAGNAVTGGFDSAADAVDGTSLVGDELGGALRGAGEGTGGEAADLGRGGAEAAHDLADLLGLVVFLVPTCMLLAWQLPSRIGRWRRLNA